MKKPHCYLPVGCQAPETVNAVAQAMQDAYEKGAQDMKVMIDTIIRNTNKDPLQVIRDCPIPKKLRS